MKRSLKHFIACISISAVPFSFVACGENPIESETELQAKPFDIQEKAIERVDKEIARADFYKCKQQYNETRCNNFFEKFGSYDAKEIADTLNYSDDAVFIGANSSDLEPEVFNYVLVNKSLNLTLRSYEQTVEEISESRESGSPEIRFMVKTFSEGEEIYTQVTALVLDEKNIKTWEGKSSAAVTIPRGIDKIQICPSVIDENELTDVVLSSDECVVVEDIGFIEDGLIEENSTVGEKFEAKWEWSLYVPSKDE